MGPDRYLRNLISRSFDFWLGISFVIRSLTFVIPDAVL
jgi:hypothetical protein